VAKKKKESKDESRINAEESAKNTGMKKATQLTEFSSRDLEQCVERFKVFLEADEDLIFILDKEGCFLTLNEFGPSALEYTSDELIGTHLIDLISMKDRTKVADSFQKIISEKSLISFKASMISKFGKEIFYEFNAKALTSSNLVTGLLGIGKNVTQIYFQNERFKEIDTRLNEANRLLAIERSRANQRKSILEELNRLKGEFISNISHELRTPLASIIGFSETIASDPNMPLDMKNEFNNIILNEGKRLAKMINDVLDVSRMEGGVIDLNKSEFDCIELLNELIQSNKQIIEEKNITFTVEMPDEPAMIFADPDRILQAFNSLLSNAVKFTDKGGRISLIVQNLYKEFEVIIADTGAGIPEKDIPHIFEKFYRVNRPGTEIAGTGLGLVFVKQIVDLHRGLIKIESELGKGTSVLVKLPKNFKKNHVRKEN
jgi:PAS domain S-box-containing protein